MIYGSRDPSPCRADLLIHLPSLKTMIHSPTLHVAGNLVSRRKALIRSFLLMSIPLMPDSGSCMKHSLFHAPHFALPFPLLPCLSTLPICTFAAPHHPCNSSATPPPPALPFILALKTQQLGTHIKLATTTHASKIPKFNPNCCLVPNNNARLPYTICLNGQPYPQR